MNTTAQISIWAFIKNSSYAIAFVGVSKYLNIIPESGLILGTLIFIDMLTGILKSGTINGWQSIRSSIMERGLIAKSLIVVAPLTIALAGRGINIDTSSFAQSIITLFILSESYSIIGNLHSIKTGVITTEFDAIAYILKLIKNILKKIITDDMPKNIK